jgi:hypothetical protein
MMGLSPREVAKLSPWIVQYGGARIAERFAAPALDLDQVPVAPEDLTPAWLTKALCRDTPGAAVASVVCTGGSDGTTSRRAHTLTYNAAGEDAKLPTRLFAKATPKLTSRLVGCSIGKIAAEVGFYREFRDRLDIEATRTLYAAYDPPSGRCAMLFEDLTARGYRFLGGPSAYVDRNMAEDMVRLLASYHGALWDHPDLKKHRRWLRTTFEFQSRVNRILEFEERCYHGMDRAAAVIDPSLLADRRTLWRGHMRSVELHSRGPLTLAHWDMHIGNWYVTPQGRMGLSDWCMMKGQWAGDFAYALVSALTIEDRRAWERELIACYLDALAAKGVKDPPTTDQAWLAYRQQMFHPFFYWAVTVGAGKLQPNMQPDQICLTNLERMSAALVDLESLKSLEAA